MKKAVIDLFPYFTRSGFESASRVNQKEYTYTAQDRHAADAAEQRRHHLLSENVYQQVRTRLTQGKHVRHEDDLILRIGRGLCQRLPLREELEDGFFRYKSFRFPTPTVAAEKEECGNERARDLEGLDINRTWKRDQIGGQLADAEDHVQVDHGGESESRLLRRYVGIRKGDLTVVVVDENEEKNVSHEHARGIARVLAETPTITGLNRSYVMRKDRFLTTEGSVAGSVKYRRA